MVSCSRDRESHGCASHSLEEGSCSSESHDCESRGWEEVSCSLEEENCSSEEVPRRSLYLLR